MVTIRASEQGLLQIDRARRRKGWLKQSEIWCRMAQTSRATLKRFWRCEAIEQGTFIAICQAVGLSDWEAICESDQGANELHLCLSAMPDVPIFLGRTADLVQLTEWAKRCRLIVLWGMGGIGKTSLVAEWVESFMRSGAAAQEFEAIFWRSLQYNPSLEALSEILTSLQHRNLIILDNWEVLLGGTSAGQVKPECAEFSQMLQQIGTSRHKSCVVIISREKPAELALLEGMNPLIQSYKLKGLGEDAIALLQHRGLQEEQSAWQALIQLYRGNPLALNMVASLIQEMCQGSTTAFLKMNTIVVHQLNNVLAERIQCLSKIELDVLRTLAQVGEPVSREWLQDKIEASRSQLLEILLSLERRCLLEILSEDTVLFALAPIVQKYITQQTPHSI
ncbi:hypothetical protein Q2T42_07395 [Leptolyngbya boryana CZ1]|uniref:NB-ARC domain-containing protein n=1 Tax=Leptolyngbya boryana CZ1 TaxID=3060204 RepID=A0AA96WXT5_LEPBY|nr:hypothetical protein [Leptolyngbya boryana]WNZ47655.1 hypothetical protein Q2T42_07395 [Leptolyngbya boryana CZ1]